MLLFLCLMLVGVLVGCSEAEPIPTLVSAAVVQHLITPPPTPLLATVAATAVSLPTPTATSLPIIRVGASTAVPSELITAAKQISEQQPQLEWSDEGAVDLLLTVAKGTHLATWVYAIAAPFATITDNISMLELQSANWFLDENVATVAPFLLGKTAVSISSSTTLIDTLWQERTAFTLLPFHQLTPRLKVLHLDGVSPLAAEMDVANYPLKIEVGLIGSETAVSTFLAAWEGPTSNRDPAKMTQVAMSGVTALVRATAHQMELNGVLYPGTAVAPVLQSADIAHVSNEVAFAPDCPYPNPLGGTTFCSRDSYFSLLQELGIDVVELTGNHLNDWGADSLTHTLDLYSEANIETFGGGSDLISALEAAIFNHNGNQIAFVGCNPVGPAYAWATTDRAGSLPCGDSFFDQISELNEAGYAVIATQQYHEFYHYAPTSQQQIDFKAIAAAGATAVSGSQGHHAQGFDFAGETFIHYGLGNLFFDQMNSLGTRRTFVDLYTFYNGRLLSVELWTGLIENYARPREMTAAERAQALTAVFEGSGW